MKAEIKKLWVDALRSGEYKQTTDILHDETNGGYCCLGVLCELAIKAGAAKRYIGGTPPKKVVKWAELNGELGDLPKNHRYDNLAQANDDGVSFQRIARYIERYF